MAENKTKQTEASITDFINTVPNERKRTDGFALLEMMQRITQVTPKMWGPSIVGFGKYHYKYDSGHEGDAALLGFSPRKQNLVLYVLSNFDKQDALLKKLGKHKTGKVCLYINKLADVDQGVLEEIITEAWDHVKHKNEE